MGCSGECLQSDDRMDMGVGRVYKCRLGIQALMWISYAEQPLSPYSLYHALAVELGSTPTAHTWMVGVFGILTGNAKCEGLIFCLSRFIVVAVVIYDIFHRDRVSMLDPSNPRRSVWYG